VDQLHIVNADPKYPKASLIEPKPSGFLYLAAAVGSGPSALPVVLPSRKRSALLHELKGLARELERLDEVKQVSVFRAIVRPPTSRLSKYLKERTKPMHPVNYDVFVLVETTSVATAHEVQSSAAFQSLVEAIRRATDDLVVIAERNAKRIGDVDTSRQGLFLFNHFAADDPEVMRQLWDYLAGWYEVETGLDNSVAMVPLEGERSDYAIVNWARWDTNPIHHFWSQLANRSFWRYVPKNLDANHAVALPVYCRLA
jgi:hypothetical protein